MIVAVVAHYRQIYNVYVYVVIKGLIDVRWAQKLAVLSTPYDTRHFRALRQYDYAAVAATTTQILVNMR